MNCHGQPNETELAGPTNFDWDLFFTYFNLFIVIVGVFGVLFNVISIFIYTRPAMQSAINILLTGVSLIDLIFLLLMVHVYSCMFHLLLVSPPSPTTLTVLAYSRIVCYPIIQMMHSASIWTLTLISAERYVAVCLPFRARQICTSNKSVVALGIACLLSVLFNVTRFWEFELEYEGGDAPPHPVELLLKNKLYKVVYYSGLNILFNFVLPFSFIFFTNFSIIRAILFRRHQRKQLSTKEVREHSTAFMMMWVIVLFVVCYTLLNVVYLLEMVNVCLGDTIERIVVRTGDFLIVVHTSTTWIIYYWFGQKYRMYFRSIIFTLCHCKQAATLAGPATFPNFSVPSDNANQGRLKVRTRSCGADRVRDEEDRVMELSEDHIPFITDDRPNKRSQSSTDNNDYNCHGPTRKTAVIHLERDGGDDEDDDYPQELSQL